MRRFPLAAGLGLMWFALVQDSATGAGAPIWGVAVILVVRLLTDFIGAWLVLSILQLVLTLSRLGLGQLRARRQEEVR
jgi:hypothetical protein